LSADDTVGEFTEVTGLTVAGRRVNDRRRRVPRRRMRLQATAGTHRRRFRRVRR
jgi:hypothetical protein